MSAVPMNATVCKNGHALTYRNTRVYLRNKAKGTKYRVCLDCRKAKG